MVNQIDLLGQRWMQGECSGTGAWHWPRIGLGYKGDVDIGKGSEWETFYNFNRPHGAFKGKAPYEELRERL